MFDKLYFFCENWYEILQCYFLDAGHDWCEYRLMDKPHRRCRRCGRNEKQLTHEFHTWVRD